MAHHTQTLDIGPPPPPDFDSYRPTGDITAATPTETGLTVTWWDGRVDTFNRFWLRENAVMPGVVDPETREREFDVSDWPDDVAVADARYDADAAALVVTWGNDGATTRHAAAWLRAMGEGCWQPGADLPERKLWDAAGMAEPPSFDGPTVLADDTAFTAWLTALESFGFARLRNLPDEDGLVATVAERIGTIRPTNFGFLFTVESKPDPDSTAYTGKWLAPHTDLPTRETQPGLQLLHCRENTCIGGASIMVDGFRVAAEVARTDSPAFRALTEISWLFSNRHRDTDYRWCAPIVRLAPSGRIDEVRMANFLRAQPDCPPEQHEDAYRAVRLFMTLSRSERFMCRSNFAAGDLVIFDNRRILHGRDAFEPTEGVRRLEGCYLDRDELHSCLRILARRQRERANTLG